MTPTARISTRRDPVLWTLLGTCALLALAYNFAIALGYAPDEPRHMNYVRLLWDEHTLPFLLPDGSEYHGAHSLHPPLYYAFLSPLFALSRALLGENGWHVVRLLSAALCLLSLWLLFGVARTQGNRWLALLATAQVGLLPIWGMTAGAINNDGASLLAQSALLWLLAVRFPRDRSVRSALLLGLALGLGALCKATNIVCGGVAFGLYLVLQAGGIRAALRSTQTWKRLGVATCMALLVCGAWYARSIHLYGQLTPIESGYTHPALGAAPRFGVLTILMHPAFLPLLGTALWGIFYSLWAQKDWIPEILRLPIYATLALYCVAGGLGNLRRTSRFHAPDETEHEAGDANRTPVRLAPDVNRERLANSAPGANQTPCANQPSQANQTPNTNQITGAHSALDAHRTSQANAALNVNQGSEVTVAPSTNQTTQVNQRPDSNSHADDELAGRVALWCGLGAFIVNVAACAAIAVFKHWGWAEGGRYLLPSLGGASLWAACGWRGLVGEKRLPIVFWIWCALILALNVVALYWLIAFLNPTYVK